MISGVRKVNVHLMQYALREKEVNAIRYYLACRLLDPEGSGWVEIEEVKPKLAIAFNVKPKTVQNNLYKLVGKGIGRVDNGRLYYSCIEAVTLGLGDHINSRSIEMSLEDISGSIVQTRAFFEKAFLASVKHNITRDKITERLGISRSTQLKYEKHNGVEETKRFSFLDLGPVNAQYLAVLRHNGEPVFFRKVDGQIRLHRQIGNRYGVDLDIVKRRVRRKPDMLSFMPKAPVDKLYFDDPESAYKHWTKNDTSKDVLYPYKWRNGELIFAILHNKKGESMVVDKYLYESNI